MKKRVRNIFIVIAVIFTVSLFVRIYSGQRPRIEKETRFMMDTFVTIYAQGPKENASLAIGAALDRLQEIDVKFNPLNPKSPLYAFNHQGKPITDPEILDLIRAGLQISKETSGAFDMTVSPLIELWGFYDKDYRVPADSEIKERLKVVGYRHISFNNGRLEKDNRGVKIDLGGIAKGYALSEAVKVLKSKGITQALVDVGGDIYALGNKGKNSPWKVGIKDPRGQDIIGYVEVENLAVIGSGDYERFFIKDRKRRHHIFDPKTGYPTEGVASVTLIYPEPISAQALAKIPFVMGPKKGLEALEKIPGMEAIVVTSSGEMLYSSGLKHKLWVTAAAK